MTKPETVYQGREGEALLALAQYPVLGTALGWVQGAMEDVPSHSQDGDLLGAAILTAALRAFASGELQQTLLPYGGILLLARVRQVIYDARTTLFAHSVLDEGSAIPVLHPDARAALDRLRWTDPLFRGSSNTVGSTLADAQTLLAGSTWLKLT